MDLEAEAVLLADELLASFSSAASSALGGAWALRSGGLSAGSWPSGADALCGLCRATATRQVYATAGHLAAL